MNRLLHILLAITALFAFACDKKPAGIDESKLEPVVREFYHPGRRELDPNKNYGLLSAKTREQITPEQWKKTISDQTTVLDSATVLKKETVKGVTYGVVSFSETVNNNRTTGTATWVLEENKWRRLKLPRLIWDMDRAVHANDYSTARNTAEKLLAVDPFSLEAYETLLYCNERAGLRSKLPVAGSSATIVQTMLKINPDDTRALFTAVSRAKDLRAGRKYLQRLRGTARYRAAVDILAAKNTSARANEPTGGAVDDTALLIQKLLVLANMNERREFKRLASNDTAFEKLKEYLNGCEPEDAVKYAGKLGIAYYKSGDKPRASSWLDFGITFGIHSEELHQLDDILAKDKP